jgi:predicted TIM-barrel fold metal-dependent hydrolase
MDADGIEAEVCFPTVPGMAGTLFARAQDKDLALRCLQAYNDWLADTWCAADRRRLIGQLIVPLWDVRLAAAELERGVRLGHKALSFPNAPETLGLPSLGDPQWDPLWDAVEAAGIPVSLHIASGSMRGALPLEPGAGAPADVFITVAPTTNFTVLATLLFSGVLARHPRLRFLSVEGGIGWLPYLLQRADETFRKHRHWTKPPISEPPSFYFRRQLFANFLDDAVGVVCRHHIGVDNLMFETDYPHSDTTFPHSREVAARTFAEVPADEARKMLRDNAIRFFGLEAAA